MSSKSLNHFLLLLGLVIFLLFINHVNIVYAFEIIDEIATHRHECFHDQVYIPYNKLPEINATYKNIMTLTSSNKAFTASIRQNLRFEANFKFDEACKRVGQNVPAYDGTSSECTLNDILTPSKNKALNTMVQASFDFLGKSLLVDPVDELTIPANACAFLSTPSLVIKNKDYIIYVTANPREGIPSVVAWARWCVRDKITGRPLIGHMNFLPSSIKSYVPIVDIHVAMHELTHALGFSDLANTAKSYIGPHNEVIPGSIKIYRPNLEKEVTLITTPKVLEVARRHFGCETLDGVEIEDSGGAGTAGSHWKKRILFEEVLVGVVTSANLFYSSFTLAFLEDLGYYSVNYDLAEDNFRWGRNKTCRFLYNKCNDQDDSVDEFCFERSDSFSQVCSHDRLGVGACDVVDYNEPLPTNYQYFNNSNRGGGSPQMDYCPTIMFYSNINCLVPQEYEVTNFLGTEPGIFSRCFESNLITGTFPTFGNGARCFPIVCTNSRQILIRIQGQTVYCPEDGSSGAADTSHLIGVHGKIICPEFDWICSENQTNGISQIPESTLVVKEESTIVPEPVQHSPINFTLNYDNSCKKRIECAMQLTSLFSTCRLNAKKILDCFGRDCELEMRKWVDKNGLTQQCKDTKILANSCIDGWMGANELCKVASASFVITPWISIIVIVILSITNIVIDV